jgi:hypothetical protein
MNPTSDQISAGGDANQAKSLDSGSHDPNPAAHDPNP